MLKLAPTEKTKFFHLEQLRVGQVFTFFAWYLTQVGVGQVVCLIFAWYLSQVGLGQVRFFFFAWCLGPESQCAS